MAEKPRPLKLEVSTPGGDVETLVLAEPGPLWVGRGEDCHVMLPSRAVSRRHVSLMLEDRGLIVADHSYNGTIVDDALLRKSRRIIGGPKCTIKVGPYTLSLTFASSRNSSSRSSSNSRNGAKSSGAAQAGAATPPDGRGGDTDEVQASPVLRRRVHRKLLDFLELPKMDRAALQDPEMRAKVIAGLRRIIADLATELPAGLNQERLVEDLANEALGLGPLEDLLSDPDVSEIMVVDPHTVFAERRGKLQHTGLCFTDNESVRAVVERIVTPLGRRIDESTPLVDARLKDGSRVNAVIPPLAIKGACITIRKFAKDPLTIEDLVRFGSINQRMADFLQRSVRIRKNVVISGGTGSGKTTLLNVLSAAISEEERIVTIEDAAELQLGQPHVVSLESRPPNLEGKGEYTIRDLVKNALRMRPDRIVVGECRGGEALDMLQAMNTGHDGSMTTTHANSPKEALSRIETLCLMAGIDLPIRAIRAQIAASVHVIVQQTRFSDGSRRVTSVTEILGVGDEGDIEFNEIFRYVRTGTNEDGKIVGEFEATGYLPTFIDQFIANGMDPEGDLI